MRGFAPADDLHDGRVTPTAFYGDFIHDPLTGDQYRELYRDLVTPADAVIEFLVEYDNVLTQDIRIL